MALPVLTPGRRRTRRWPLAAAASLVAVALVIGATRPWEHASPPAPRLAGGHTVAERRTQPPSSPHPTATPTPPPVLLTGAATRHRHRFAPRLGARGAILVNERTGAILWALEPYRRLPIASTTKIMTAALALERLRPAQIVTVSRLVPRVPLIREGLRAGERVPVQKLLYGLLLFSGNDDALALAQATAGSRPAFIALMNEKARALGLTGTHFTTPSGVIDSGNYSTARDLAALTRYARRDARFRRIVRTKVKRVSWPAPTFSKVYVNKNALLSLYAGADGVKTGWTTKARHCLVASARRGPVHLLAVVLGSPDAFTDAKRLLDYGFRLRGR
jgi:D-alanyl-D-alanine carboxypeptidase